METSVNNKCRAFTSLEQSKKLAEILPLESADNYYSWHDERYYIVNKDCPYPYSIKERIPCWSLSALLDVLPEGWSSVLTKSFDGEDYYCKLDGEPIETMADNPVDACYELIIKLNELKML